MRNTLVSLIRHINSLYNRTQEMVCALLTVLDLWENQMGVSNVFLTHFDSFWGGQYKNGGLRCTRGGYTPSRQIEHWLLRIYDNDQLTRYWEFAAMSDALQMRAPEKRDNENCASSKSTTTEGSGPLDQNL